MRTKIALNRKKSSNTFIDPYFVSGTILVLKLI